MKGWVWAGLCAALAATPAAAAGAGPGWRIEGGDVKVLVPLRPGGAFTATTTSLSGTLGLAGERPARLGGELKVDLSTIDTGIALRNQHLKEKYLEVAKGPGYDTAVVADVRLKDAEGEAFQGTAPFTAALTLHGVTNRVEGTADIRHVGANRRVKAVFPLVLTEFGIEAPQYLGVGVGTRLMVTAQFTAVPAAPAAK
jgi:polyisoprenoid-binding protein YceI